MQVISNRGLAQQEPTTSDNGISVFKQAQKGIKVKAASKEDWEQLFRRLMMKVGLRAQNIITPQEAVVIIDFILKNFADFTIELIDHAFDMALSGRLEVDAKSYENFSCQYIGAILASYKDWAIVVNRQIKQEEKPLQVVQEVPEISDADYLKTAFQGFKMLKSYELIPLEIYRILDLDKKLTHEQKIKIHSDVLARIEQNRLDMKYNEWYKTIPDKTQWIKDQCKKYAVGQYFNKLIQNKQNV